jgi:hypothetical protein
MSPRNLSIFNEKKKEITQKNIDFFVLLRYTYNNNTDAVQRRYDRRMTK